MWDLPGPGIEPMSPALTGGFLATEPPGKSRDVDCLMLYIHANLSDEILYLECKNYVACSLNFHHPIVESTF